MQDVKILIVYTYRSFLPYHHLKSNLLFPSLSPQGLCKCDRGYGGADCGLDLSQGPHVTALNNLGLCDVRTKPCRDVIVTAEQLATQASDELKCIIEIYKVCKRRGFQMGRYPKKRIRIL